MGKARLVTAGTTQSHDESGRQGRAVFRYLQAPRHAYLEALPTLLKKKKNPQLKAQHRAGFAVKILERTFHIFLLQFGHKELTELMAG